MPIEQIFNANSLLGFGGGVAMTVFLLAVGHWFPHPGQTKLPKTVANLIIRYIYGTTALWSGSTIWLVSIGYWWIALGLFGVNIAGGVIVIIAYHWDEHLAAMGQRKILKDADDELTR